MKKFSQFILFCGIVSVPVFKHWGPREIPQNGIPTLPAVVEADAEQKAVTREIQQAHEVFTKFGCGWEDLSVLTARYSRKRKLPTRLVAAQIVVESSCKPDAVSPTGSVGLLQVNEKVWKTGENLKDPETNLRVGTKILADYIHVYGVKEGLHHYNGMGDPTDQYSSKILEIARR